MADIALSIIPTSGGEANIFHFTSKCGEVPGHESEELLNLIRPGNSVHRHASMDFYKCSDFNQEHLLPSGHSVVATCTADLSQAVSAADLRFHVFLSYLLIDDGKSSSEMLTGNTVPVGNFEEYCSELIVTSHDLLNETFSVGISKDDSCSQAPALTIQDLWALDCLQKNLTLTVQSAVSSVTCLPLKLASHPSIRYLEWAKQFLFVASHWLKHCRLQILEQDSRHRATIKVFFRSHSQALLLVNFLYSRLPKDITITLTPPSRLSTITHTGQTVLWDIDRNIHAIKQRIDSVRAAMVPSGEETMSPDESLSPKFHTKKSSKIQQEVSKPTALGEASATMGDLVGERKQFRRAKKRFREIWGDEDKTG